MSMFGPTVPNPTAGGRPGGILYEGWGQGRCNCYFTTTYPYSIGPRIGAPIRSIPRPSSAALGNQLRQYAIPGYMNSGVWASVALALQHAHLDHAIVRRPRNPSSQWAAVHHDGPVSTDPQSRNSALAWPDQ